MLKSWNSCAGLTAVINEGLSFILIAGVSLLALSGVSFSFSKLGVPTIVAFIIVGLFLPESVEDLEALYWLSEIGIILLFFVLGLQFPLAKMLRTARKVLMGGLLDLALNFGGTTGLALLMGVDLLGALFIGGIAYASSSSITLSLLEQKRRLANPEAEFILALLVFEDIAAPILISVLKNVEADGAASAGTYGILVLNVVLLTAGAVLLGRFVFSRLGEFIEHHLDRDYTVLLTIGVALAYAGLAVALGLSEVLGAFLAGVVLAETGRAEDLDRIALPVRNLTLPFFFVHFGATIPMDGTLPMPLILVTVTAFSLVGKLAVGIVGGKAFGLSPRVALRAGFSLLQRGEFSVVIAALAPYPLNLLGGIYVIVSALIGVVSFSWAPALSKTMHQRFENVL